MDDCVQLARRLGARVGGGAADPGVPLRPRRDPAGARERSPDVRKGEFEGLREAIGTDPARAPDFGPRRIHPTAGATAIGARPFLVAYNVYLASGDDVALAKAIAKERADLLRRPAGGAGAAASTWTARRRCR